MKLVGLMLIRSEDWILPLSIKVALRWCDAIAVMNHASIDKTAEIIKNTKSEYGENKIGVYEWPDASRWDEMFQRQRLLDLGRGMGGTHFAIIDADEILTHNFLGNVRSVFETLKPKQTLDVPMFAPWKSLEKHSPATKGAVTLGFMDDPSLLWKPRGIESYQHHGRPPHGIVENIRPSVGRAGVLHLQFAAWDRFIWKHRHYMMTEKIRWNYPVNEINNRYHWWNRDSHGQNLEEIPQDLWGDYDKSLINLTSESRYSSECQRLLNKYGSDKFKGLNLFGWLE